MTQSLADFLEVFGDVNKTGILLLLLALGSIFRIKGYIDGPGLIELFKTTTISYFSTTTIVHFTSMIRDHLDSKVLAGAIDKAKEAIEGKSNA